MPPSPPTSASGHAVRHNPSKPTRTGGFGKKSKKRPRETLNTIAFDSVGPRKYAVQLYKAGNGNPVLKIVEGIPNGDGSFRKIYLTVYSEDFERFFQALGDTYRFIQDHHIATPKDHKTPKTMPPRRKEVPASRKPTYKSAVRK